jgi:hypothetical protein
MNTKKILCGLFMFILLASCAPIFVPQSSMTMEAIELSFTESPIPSVTATYTETFTPTSFPSGFTPSPVPTPTYPEGSCQQGPVEELKFVPPSPSDLKWETMDNFQRLTGLTEPVNAAYPSPDERWWVIELVTKRDSEQYELATEEALYVLDSMENKHWVASANGKDDFHRFDWFPNSDLLWVDEGQVYKANADGQEKQAIQTPEPMIEVWLDKITGSRALVSGESALWRLDLSTITWEKVKGLESLVKNGEPPISRTQANLRMSNDGSFGALLADHQIWKVPMAFGEPARKVGEVDYSDETWRPEAPQPLVDSPYWYPGRNVYISDPSNPQSSALALINEEDGSLLSLQHLVPPDFNSLSLNSLQISPDARWIAFSNGELHHASMYLISTSQLIPGKTNGWIIEDVYPLLDWDISEVRSSYPAPQIDHPATAFVFKGDLASRSATLDQINLLTGEVRTIKKLLLDPSGYLIIRRMTWVKNTPILVEGEMIERISEEGTLQLIGSIPELHPYEYPRLLVGGTKDQLLFVSAVDKSIDKVCRTYYSLYIAKLDFAK